MCLTCVLLVPSFFSLQHFHPKEAVAAAAAGSEDDFEEKSPSAKSFSLRGAVAVAAAEGDHCQYVYLPVCDTTWRCKLNSKRTRCVPRMFEDEDFDSQDLEKFDAPEGDEVHSDYDEVNED